MSQTILTDLMPVFFGQAEATKISAFVDANLIAFQRNVPSELWHYTDANGLLGIIKSRAIWTTQVSCLNDRSEHRLLNALTLSGIRNFAIENRDDRLNTLLRVAEQGLGQADFDTAPHFVCSFTEAADDLGQWRGYGGGENGFAIGFWTIDLMAAASRRAQSGMLPLSYDKEIHANVVRNIISCAQNLYIDGLTKPNIDPTRWAWELVTHFSERLDIFACLIKDPAFSAEREHRLLTLLNEQDYTNLEFKPKRSLLSRHLPVSLATPRHDGRLPISRICIGPSASPRISQLSVEALLRQQGYPSNVTVELSRVPYRIP
ncbi:MAG TPA: DUF2971 domain-containing protein [Acidisoma sp.]|jgi:hypothetical protein|uniref:DUF2971 domain-containing protein n=1 Tax=Acidisoma sp. TaxID=1872115 RepID=UPI002C5E3DBB|nr:DUF2971 domain-containing protein [Acidisoma sp.]HTI03196.1 DUF2971 domain-containing protein [Acidisoma sp.]